MTANFILRLDTISVLDVVGEDAAKILHNLTTNDVQTLDIGFGCETFVTNVRGKILGHVVAFRAHDRFRLVGPAGQSESLAAHIDKYTITEDARPEIHDADWVALAITSELPIARRLAQRTTKPTSPLVQSAGPLGSTVCQVPWLGAGSAVVLALNDSVDGVVHELADCDDDVEVGDEAKFHHVRTRSGFPWYGVDLSEDHLPQESDRIAQTISFTKGCYLGQETVARLDALGQVQKKIVGWSVTGAIPPPGAAVSHDEKVVGRLTSIAVLEDGTAKAIGMARRSHFVAGATAHGGDGKQTFTATVQ